MGVGGVAADSECKEPRRRVLQFWPRWPRSLWRSANDTATSNYGVYGVALDSLGTGVHGQGRQGVSGWGFSGVFGASESELGVGVLGTNFSNTSVSYEYTVRRLVNLAPASLGREAVPG